MRLVCPNCDAKYEVPDDAIPDTGRDVQCASCGHAWFQMRSRPAAAAPVIPAAAPAAAPAPAPARSEKPKAEKARTDKTKAEDVAAPAPVAAPVPPPVADQPPAKPMDAWPEGEADEFDEPAVEAPPRDLDLGVMEILREEAEREMQARRAAEKPPEPAPAPEPRKKPVVHRQAPEPEPEPVPEPEPAPVRAPEPEAAAMAAPRRDLLPDVEEINSTLESSEDEDEEEEDEDDLEEPGQGAFRAGFLLSMTIAILGAALYISAGWLASMVPALAGVLETYVGLIDALRLKLDDLAQMATQLIAGDKD